jgi:amidophosphoribosyltransferase
MCGIFGVFNVRKAAELTVIGLHGNQHRAMDFAGIVSSDDEHFYRHRGEGIARKVFDDPTILNRLHGLHAIGHIRYPTGTDDTDRENIQPIEGRYGNMPIALVHNGNLTNKEDLRTRIPHVKLSTSMDTEYILRLIEKMHTGDIEADLTRVFSMLRGSYELGILLPHILIAVRDPMGNHPLSIGRLNGGYCISSETVAFTSIEGAEHLMDVEPGTMVCITRDGVRTVRFAEATEKKCRFESIYYSHPGSVVFGESVSRFRRALGVALEESAPVPGADIVTPIPDSSNFIALGYAQSGRSGVYDPVIFRSHYVGRTFIVATQAQRDAESSGKSAFDSSQIAGKSIVVVDDSIVRGTTIPKIVAKLWELQAREVHVRIGSPPVRHPCTYGIHTPDISKLVSAQLTTEELRVRIRATSLAFTPLEVLQDLSPSPESFCFACMDGNYW